MATNNNFLFLLLLLFNFHFRLSFSDGDSNSMESVPDLQKSMYKVIDGYPCVRLLSLSGPIGCSNPGRQVVVAPIVRYQNATQLSQSSSILVSLDEFQSFITRHAFSFICLLCIASSATNETLDALEQAQDSLKSEHIICSVANASNPGIPPSSLMTFLQKNSHTSGVVLEDFNSVFSNKFYHSHLDDTLNINSSAVVAAASLVARTLYILASDNNTLSSSALTAINVNVSLVEELMGCLLGCDPGLSCNLVKNYISPTNTCPSHYVGVIPDEPSSTPYLGYVDDVSRFLWNFLADRTSIPRENSSSTCSKGCNNGEVCVRAETEGKGVCVISTTRYVPAYSTRLKFDSEAWIVLPPNSSDPMGMVDPVWTESNWNAIGLRVYTVQNGAYDNLVLLGGMAITVLAYLAIVITRAFITKSLKRD
ncbi:nicastrin-like [Quercus lobata]|uniref:nicastrin-like n=1 Tax=Quercus lobata TaxID=97700 RepID=UPI001247CB74|nr:nicastrin-like [Quercus lobata]